MMKARTHHLFVVIATLLSVPLCSALGIAIKFKGGIDHWRPWLLLTEYPGLNAEQSQFAIQSGIFGAIFVFAGLMFLFDGFIFGVKTTDSHGDARWATRRETRKANLLQSWGVAFGKYGSPKSRGEILRTNDVGYSNILVSAPPRSGKGVGVIIPTILEYPGTVLVYDIKGENFERTARQRAALGDKVLVFSPFDMYLEDSSNHGFDLNRKSHSFNPLIEIANIDDLEDRLIAIQALTSSLLTPKSSTGAEASLLEDGRSIMNAALAVLCHEARANNTIPSFGKLNLLLSPAPIEGETPDYKKTMANLAERAGDPISKAALYKAAGSDNKQLGIYLSVVQGAGLNAWENPAVVRATERNDIDLNSLRTVPQTIYVAIPPQYKEVATPLVRMFFQYAINRLRTHALHRDGEKKYLPVLFMIDEFHTLGKMPAVMDGLTNIPGYGGRMCLVVQSPESLVEHYGKAGASVMMDSIQAQVFMAPNAEETKKSLSAALGTKTIATKSLSSKGISSKDHSTNTSYSEKGRALMTPEELGRLSAKKLIVIPQNQRPVLVDKIRYFEDSHYSKIVAAQDKMAWPVVPSIKAADVTTSAGFLDMAGTDPRQPVERQDEGVNAIEPYTGQSDIEAGRVDDHQKETTDTAVPQVNAEGDDRAQEIADRKAYLDRLMNEEGGPQHDQIIADVIAITKSGRVTDDLEKLGEKLSASEMIAKLSVALDDAPQRPAPHLREVRVA